MCVIFYDFHNVLPTYDNLLKCKLKIDLKCKCCGFEVESAIHTLIRFPGSKVIWKVIGLWYVKMAISRSPITDLLAAFLEFDS